jgi:hypothetical protein
MRLGLVIVSADVAGCRCFGAVWRACGELCIWHRLCSVCLASRMDPHIWTALRRHTDDTRAIWQGARLISGWAISCVSAGFRRAQAERVECSPQRTVAALRC